MGFARLKLVGVVVLAGFCVGFFFSRPLLTRMGSLLVLARPAPGELRADLIVVLDGDPARHMEGARLVREGAAPRILFTMRRLSAERYGRYEVPEGKGVVPVIPSDNTYEEAVAVRETIKDLRTRGVGPESILLITSDYHSRRAARIFRTVLPPSISITVYPVSSGHLSEGRDWWHYGVSRRVIVGEYLKLAYYFVRYPGGVAPREKQDPARQGWLRNLYERALNLVGSQADHPPKIPAKVPSAEPRKGEP